MRLPFKKHKFRMVDKNGKLVSTEAKKSGGDLKNFILKVVGLASTNGAGRDEFGKSEFDFNEIETAYKKDSYLKISKEKYAYLIFKSGYNLKSNNNNAVEYIESRFAAMSYCTNVPMDILFQEIADDLFVYSNAFLIKARTDTAFPGINAKPFLGKKIVGGYFRLQPSSVQIKRDKNGNVKKYMQEVDGETKEYPIEDVIHIYMDKEADSAFGTPRAAPVLEDVMILRKIEGFVLDILYRFASPIFQWKIGLPDKGMQASEEEVDEAKDEVENSSLNGVIVTNEKVDIKAIGTEGETLNILPYLQYFEKRVFSSLNLSEAQMGRGGSKQDADSMEEQAHNTIKYIQKILSIFIENLLMNELLFEGGFNPIINKDDRVSFVFNEINLDTKIKLENHELLKYQSNGQTVDEYRKNIGADQIEDENRLYKNFIEIPSIIKEIDAKADAEIKVSTEVSKLTQSDADTAGIKGNGTSKSKGVNKDSKNRDMPQNQNGTYSVKVKEQRESLDKIYKIIDNNATTKSSKTNELKKYFDNCYVEYYEKGSADACILLREHDIKTKVQCKTMDEFTTLQVNYIANEMLNSNRKYVENKGIFLLNKIKNEAYWSGYVNTDKTNGIKKVLIKESNDYNTVILDDNIKFNKFPKYSEKFEISIFGKEV